MGQPSRDWGRAAERVAQRANLAPTPTRLGKRPNPSRLPVTRHTLGPRFLILAALLAASPGFKALAPRPGPRAEQPSGVHTPAAAAFPGGAQ